MYALYIHHKHKLFEPVVQSGVQWDTSRKGSPGKLTFSLVKDAVIDFAEGDAVSFYDGETQVFYGFVFKKSRDKSGVIDVVAYDQLRYLKNKDTYVYTNKTASEVVRMLAEDFSLKLGTVEDTRHKIDSRVEDNQTLFDIIQNALDLTLTSTRQLYVLYDNFGRLTLHNISSMKVKSRLKLPLLNTLIGSPLLIAVANSIGAISGRPQGPYTVKKRSPVVGRPYSLL